ncbi:MAG: DUF697 domain-containing protein [Bacteroidia bacterium]|nr:DUF697 domain-containing protein [Bacteroidia bacterium]
MAKPEKNARSAHAETIIRNHVIWSMGAGLIPVLIADIFAVSALQLDMIRQLCRAYDQDFSETQGKAIVTSLTSSTLARLGARSLIKLIPGVGSIIGGMTVSIFAGASTYALGEVFKKHFDSGGTILDFDPDRLKKYYQEKFEKGKKVASELKKNKKAQKEAKEFTPEDVASTDEVKTKPTAAPKNTKKKVDKSPEDKAKGEEILGKLKELFELKDKGAITQEEFEKIKKEIINGKR